VPGASADRGRAVIAAIGCGACHAIPGVPGPDGTVGPPLDGFARRSLIAGSLPNRPEVLVRFVADAPALLPETGMPDLPLSDQEARDVAAYLYTLD
jgi:cytochrome c1